MSSKFTDIISYNVIPSSKVNPRPTSRTNIKTSHHAQDGWVHQLSRIALLRRRRRRLRRRWRQRRRRRRLRRRRRRLRRRRRRLRRVTPSDVFHLLIAGGKARPRRRLREPLCCICIVARARRATISFLFIKFAIIIRRPPVVDAHVLSPVRSRQAREPRKSTTTYEDGY